MGRMKRHDGTKWIDVAPSAQEFDAHQADYTQLKGDLSTLKTTAKDNIPNIVNELFTNVSNGKSLVGGAITGVDNSVVIPTEPTFQQLANAIGSISTGKKWASGTVNRSSSTRAFYIEASGSTTMSWYSVTVSGLSFKPSLIILRQDINSSDELITYLLGDEYMGTSSTRSTGNTFPKCPANRSPAYVRETGFLLPIVYGQSGDSSKQVNWLAIE